MNTLNRFARIYNVFIKLNIMKYAAFRSDALVGGIVANVVWSTFTVYSMYLITLRIRGAFGWTREDLILLACMFNISVGLFSVFFMHAFQDLPYIINRGSLDAYLLKPLDSQFYISSYNISISSAVRVIFGIILTILVTWNLGLQLELLNIFTFAILLIFGGLLLYSGLYILCTLLIWFPQLDNITDLFYNLRAMGRYPSGVLRAQSEFLFLLFSPFILPVSIPTRAILGKITAFELGELLFLSIGLFLFSRIFWKFALRHYTSASG